MDNSSRSCKHCILGCWALMFPFCFLVEYEIIFALLKDVQGSLETRLLFLQNVIKEAARWVRLSSMLEISVEKCGKYCSRDICVWAYSIDCRIANFIRAVHMSETGCSCDKIYLSLSYLISIYRSLYLISHEIGPLWSALHGQTYYPTRVVQTG